MFDLAICITTSFDSSADTLRSIDTSVRPFLLFETMLSFTVQRLARYSTTQTDTHTHTHFYVRITQLIKLFVISINAMKSFSSSEVSLYKKENAVNSEMSREKTIHNKLMYIT